MMNKKEIITSLTNMCADVILKGFDEYQDDFKNITRRAEGCFKHREWEQAHTDFLERLDLYSRKVMEIVSIMQTILVENLDMASLGPNIKRHYIERVKLRDDVELAETFFNSVIRKFFLISGVTPGIEFISADFSIPEIVDKPCPIGKTFSTCDGRLTSYELFRDILFAYKETLSLIDPEGDALRIAQRVDTYILETKGFSGFDYVEMIDSVFYREKAAYVIGRIRIDTHLLPLAIAFLNERGGGIADAVLLTEDENSILFGFTRSYFHVNVDKPSEMVNFLKTILPNKRVSEIYTSIGFHKHGKAELYREYTRSLERCSETFEIARGEKGMVMIVFTLPSFDVVFKIIKDRFDYPKSTNRHAVRECYRLVFRHNRAGRLLDTQQFSNLEFDISLFSDELLDEFRRVAKETVVINGSRVLIKHLYTERRLIPLDIYLRESGEKGACEAIIDYGRSIKELASCNIFPGDLFLKNFGVTRHKRVVFYDYDELCLLTECNFRRKPRARNDYEELASEPWYYVGEHDVFPEEFRTFLNVPSHLKAVFEKEHSDLYGVDYWKQMQERLTAGNIMHIFPYKKKQRLLMG